MVMVAFLLCFLLQTPRPSPVPGMPAASGVYFRQDESKWLQLEHAAMAEMKTKGMGLFVATDGLSSLGMTTVYQGSKAPVQISSLHPVFYVRSVGSPQDAMIVQLTQKKDTRTIQASTSASTLENKGGFKKEAVRKVAVTVYSDNSFSVTPIEELKPGEYLLVFGYADAGFDFGITR
jgi:hypothetical protein